MTDIRDVFYEAVDDFLDAVERYGGGRRDGDGNIVVNEFLVSEGLTAALKRINDDISTDLNPKWLYKGLYDATLSLETIARHAGSDELLTSMDQVRGYADGRARVARKFLMEGDDG